MKINDLMSIRGELTIVHRGPSGSIKQALTIPNLIVEVGKQFIASRMTSNNLPVMSHMAIGSGLLNPISTDVSLITELGRVGAPLFSAQADGKAIVVTATFGPGIGTGYISEAGIFNSDSAGIMICRTIFPTLAKESGDTIGITWIITIA